MPKSTRARRAAQEITDKERLKKIRSYVSFNYDLRKPLPPAARRKIRAYYDEIEKLQARPHNVFRPRTPAHVKKAQKFAQHGQYLPGLKVAFVPNDGTSKTKLRYTARGYIGELPEVQWQLIPLKVKLLESDLIQHVNRQVAKYPAKRYTIGASEFEIPGAYDAATIASGVKRLADAYNNEASNHYFGRWLHSLRAYSFGKQEHFAAHAKKKTKGIKDYKRAKQTERRKDQARKKKWSPRDMGR